MLGFAHPPWCLIARLLMKVQVEGATVVLVTPLWETQPWFPVFMSMLVDLPFLPNIPDLLTQSPNCDCPLSETQWTETRPSWSHGRSLVTIPRLLLVSSIFNPPPVGGFPSWSASIGGEASKGSLQSEAPQPKYCHT